MCKAVPCVVEIRDEGHLTLTFSLESWRLAGVGGVVPLESGVGIQSAIALVRMNWLGGNPDPAQA